MTESLLPAAIPELGDLIAGKYRITSALGVGGMGAVFAADDQQLGRSVAITVLLPKLAQNPEATARFVREARAAFRRSFGMCGCEEGARPQPTSAPDDPSESAQADRAGELEMLAIACSRLANQRCLDEIDIARKRR